MIQGRDRGCREPDGPDFHLTVGRWSVCFLSSCCDLCFLFYFGRCLCVPFLPVKGPDFVIVCTWVSFVFPSPLCI